MSAPSADMICGRPSVQLRSVLDVDSKLGLTMVRPSLQSEPEPPLVSKHDARLRWTFLMSGDLHRRLFQLEIGTPHPLTPALGNVYSNLDFCVFFVFELWSIRTEGQTRSVMRAIGPRSKQRNIVRYRRHAAC